MSTLLSFIEHIEQLAIITCSHMSISLSVASMYSLLSASCLLTAWLATSGSSTPHFRSLLCEVNTMKSLNTADRLDIQNLQSKI